MSRKATARTRAEKRRGGQMPHLVSTLPKPPVIDLPAGDYRVECRMGLIIGVWNLLVRDKSTGKIVKRQALGYLREGDAADWAIDFAIVNGLPYLSGDEEVGPDEWDISPAETELTALCTGRVQNGEIVIIPAEVAS